MSEDYTLSNDRAETDTRQRDTVIAAGIQLNCSCDRENILKRAENYVKQAFDDYPHIDLIVLPEQFCRPGADFNDLSDDDVKKWLKSLAVKYHVNIIGGSFACISESNNDKPLNTCFVIDRNGCIVGKYNKIHLFDAFNVKESDEFGAGDKLGIFDLDIGRVGVWICYDSRFPEISRALSREGADLFCVPAAFYKPHSEQWEVLLKAASVMNVTPLIAVNQIGDLPNGRGFFGRSMATDAKGIITAGISDKEGFFVAEFDKAYTARCRKANPELKNRRFDLYRNWL